jgi:hypothetical protein
VTDAEKIARMVEWMGGWPEHKRLPTGICVRCSKTVTHWQGINAAIYCHSWNPFERIEDAFLVVERLRAAQFMIYFVIFSSALGWSAREFNKEGSTLSESPSRAIAESAWQVISRT